MTRAGILAVGAWFPDEVRRNDAWSDDLIDRWAARRGAAPPISRDGLGAGQRRVLDAMAAQAADRYLGTSERRVVAPADAILGLEERAARDAIARAGIDPVAIDLLVVHSAVPDHQLANTATTIHQRLGLPAGCLSVMIEATGYSSLAQLGLAEAAIVAGRARNALAIQSFVGSRMVARDDPSSLLVGDGATAFVLGPVSRGILAIAHYTQGGSADGLVMTVPGGRWYDPGTPRAHIANPRRLLEAQLLIADTCERAARDALQRAGYTLDDVDVLLVYPGTPWMQRVVYDQLGMTRAPAGELFQRLGYLSSAALPAALWTAERDGALADGDLVVLVGGGTGMTYGAAVLRWGAT
jgi:3-oxoacyl-[acyl-carrier-protein] synthase-3